MLEQKDLNFNYLLDELKEYKKLSIKLEEELKKNQNKISNLLNSNDELKSIISKNNIDKKDMQKQIDDLIEKNAELSDKNNLLEEHLNNINIQYKDESNFLKIRNDLFANKDDNQIELTLKLKEEEIDFLKKEILLLKEDKNQLEFELNNIKKNFNSELIKREKEKRDLYEKNLEEIQIEKDEGNQFYKCIYEDLNQLINLNKNNIEIGKLEKEMNENRKEKENEIKILKNKFFDDKNELMNQNAIILKDLESMKNKLSLKDIQLINIQKEIDKMDLNNKKLENQNVLIINENIQLKNEINDLEEKIGELQKLIKRREDEFLLEKNEYKEEIKKLKSDFNKYKVMVDIKEKEN